MPKVDARDYERLYRQTRNFSPEIRRAFRKRLRDAAQIGARAAKVKVRAMPTGGGGRYTATGAGKHVRGKKHRGLRSTLATGISVKVTGNSVRIEQSARGLSGRNADDLPRDIDRGGWQHPVYGHPPKVFQKGFPYFQSTMREKRPEMEREVNKVLDDIQAKLIARSLHIG